jgi:acetyl esterase/lipase
MAVASRSWRAIAAMLALTIAATASAQDGRRATAAGSHEQRKASSGEIAMAYSIDATDLGRLVRSTRARLAMAGMLAACAFAAPAQAQNDRMTPIAIPAQPNAIELGTGPLPGATASESWHSQYGSDFARNVTIATLTPFLPDPAKATGAAVIVAPGGGFRTLSMENEGWDVARALAERGVAAFVLKYRLNQTPQEMEEFERSSRAMFSGTARPPRMDPAAAIAGLAPQITDARAAFALIRRRAAEWRVDGDRIGMIGFSAGAMLTMATTLAGQDAKPAFIANIYGPLAAVEVPADAPPMFVALAADDPFFAQGGIGLIDSWRAAKRPAEFHLYEQGGHGFGMYPKQTTSTGWFDAFVRWIGMHGMLQRAH